MNDLFKTTLRINRATPDGLRAWAYLKNRDKSKYRSYSEAIIAAVNGFFGREQQLCNDPTLKPGRRKNFSSAGIGYDKGRNAEQRRRQSRCTRSPFAEHSVSHIT